MNKQTNSKRILCFGDSLTWGAIPITLERYPKLLRWPFILQGLLKHKVEVIEDGLMGRTISKEDSRGRLGRVGYEGFQIALEREEPLDMVILMIGINEFIETGPDTLNNALEVIEEKFIKVCKDNGIKLFIIAPPSIDPQMHELSSVWKSKQQLISEYRKGLQKLANKYGLGFLDASLFIKPANNGDGVHIDAEANTALAYTLAGYSIYTKDVAEDLDDLMEYLEDIDWENESDGDNTDEPDSLEDTTFSDEDGEYQLGFRKDKDE